MQDACRKVGICHVWRGKHVTSLRIRVSRVHHGAPQKDCPVQAAMFGKTATDTPHYIVLIVLRQCALYGLSVPRALDVLNSELKQPSRC